CCCGRTDDQSEAANVGGGVTRSWHWAAASGEMRSKSHCWLLMPTADTTPAATNNTATTIAPVRKPAKSIAVPTITLVNATAIRPAMRDTALLTAEPMPLCPGSTAASTAAVRGDTVMERPTPNTIRPGNIWVQKSNGSRA